MEIKNILVVGAGQMGQGIAQVAAQAGYNVWMVDASLDHAQMGIDKIKAQLTKMVEKQKITEAQKSSTLELLKPVGALQDLNDSISSQIHLMIEAATENFEIKKNIFVTLDQKIQHKAIFASNTSSISITALAAATKRPTQVAGMHFMNPVPVMKLVEGIRGLQTSQDVFTQIKQTAEKMGKIFIEAKDAPGFAVNRILMPMINEAVYALYEGVATVEDIDQAMKLGTNQPMGPLTLADFIGLDTCLAIMNVLHEGLGDTKYRACPLLKQYVQAGWLGRKSGRGFYSYT